MMLRHLYCNCFRYKKTNFSVPYKWKLQFELLLWILELLSLNRVKQLWLQQTYPWLELLEEQVQISSDEESQGGTSLKATRLKVPPLLFDRLRLLWLRFSFVNWLSSYKKSNNDSVISTSLILICIDFIHNIKTLHWKLTIKGWSAL